MEKKLSKKVDRELHKQHVEKFVSELFSERYSEYIQTGGINLNDDSDDEYTAYEVYVESKRGELNSYCMVLQSNDEGDIQILMGEDFESVTREECIEYIFVDNIVDWEGK